MPIVSEVNGTVLAIFLELRTYSQERSESVCSRFIIVIPPSYCCLVPSLRQSAITLLEWLVDEAADGRGENVLDLEVLWTPADADDSIDRDDLYSKWPELINV